MARSEKMQCEFYEVYGDPSLLENCATCKATGAELGEIDLAHPHEQRSPEDTILRY